MKLLISLLVTVAFISCEMKVIPLKGKYTDGNFEAYSDKSKDVVWDNLIDFFAKRGISIKIIDRSSGLIIAGATRMPWSYENSKGIIIHKDAWIVIRKVIDPGSRKPIDPISVSGEWNVRIKEMSGKTLINVNLVNPEYSYSYQSRNTQTTFKPGAFQSTGNFEKMIYDQVK